MLIGIKEDSDQRQIFWIQAQTLACARETKMYIVQLKTGVCKAHENVQEYTDVSMLLNNEPFYNLLLERNTKEINPPLLILVVPHELMEMVHNVLQFFEEVFKKKDNTAIPSDVADTLKHECMHGVQKDSLFCTRTLEQYVDNSPKHIRATLRSLKHYKKDDLHDQYRKQFIQKTKIDPEVENDAQAEISASIQPQSPQEDKGQREANTDATWNWFRRIYEDGFMPIMWGWSGIKQLIHYLGWISDVIRVILTGVGWAISSFVIGVVLISAYLFLWFMQRLMRTCISHMWMCFNDMCIWVKSSKLPGLTQAKDNPRHLKRHGRIKRRKSTTDGVLQQYFCHFYSTDDEKDAPQGGSHERRTDMMDKRIGHETQQQPLPNVRMRRLHEQPPVDVPRQEQNTMHDDKVTQFRQRLSAAYSPVKKSTNTATD